MQLHTKVGALALKKNLLIDFYKLFKKTKNDVVISKLINEALQNSPRVQSKIVTLDSPQLTPQVTLHTYLTRLKLTRLSRRIHWLTSKVTKKTKIDVVVVKPINEVPYNSPWVQLEIIIPNSS